MTRRDKEIDDAMDFFKIDSELRELIWKHTIAYELNSNSSRYKLDSVIMHYLVGYEVKEGSNINSIEELVTMMNKYIIDEENDVDYKPLMSEEIKYYGTFLDPDDPECIEDVKLIDNYNLFIEIRRQKPYLKIDEKFIKRVSKQLRHNEIGLKRLIIASFKN